MPSSKISILPDVNVWLSFAYAGHIAHRRAFDWFKRSADVSSFCFCRVTQMGLLRLLTQRSALGEHCLTQEQAWAKYDELLEEPHVTYVAEPPGLERRLRQLSSRSEVTPKLWTDDYLLAFAETAGLTIVTLDRALATRSERVILLP